MTVVYIDQLFLLNLVADYLLLLAAGRMAGADGTPPGCCSRLAWSARGMGTAF